MMDSRESTPSSDGGTSINDQSGQYVAARESLEALLANIKGNNLNLEERLNNESFSKIQYETDTEDIRKALEAKYRIKISQQTSSFEKQLSQLRDQVEEEKMKARKAMEMKRNADSKNEIFEKRSLQHQQEVSSLRSKLKVYQKRLKEVEEDNETRLPSIKAEFEIERQQASGNIQNLKRQLDQLSEQLMREQEMREAEERKNREQVKELADLKTNKKVQVYEFERLERKCRELEQQLERQKDYYERHFLPAEQLDEFKKELETKARLDLNKKLQEVNMHLEEQLLARETFDKLRTGIERKTKSCYEQTVSQLKSDLTQIKASLHEGLVKRDTSIMEAHKFKELFEFERNNSGRLAGELAKTTEMLSMERNRSNYLFDDKLNKSKVTKKLFEESLPKPKISTTPPLRANDDTAQSCSMYSPKRWNVPSSSTPKEIYLTPSKRRTFIS